MEVEVKNELLEMWPFPVIRSRDQFLNPDFAIACWQQIWVLHLDGDLRDR
jgi:hypothetical protein